MNQHTFDRKPMPYNALDFPMAGFLNPLTLRRAILINQKDWVMQQFLDQGEQPFCVGFSWAHFGISLPVYNDWSNLQAEAIYHYAKTIDGFPNDAGSDTRSGAKAFTQFGRLAPYAFAHSLQEIVTWLLVNGPVVTGTNWYSAMNKPDSSGLVHIAGDNLGGHAWLLSGVDTVTHLFKATNSWGANWGLGGQFFISFKDYQRLLDEQGDACVAVELSPDPPGVLPLPDLPPVPPLAKGCFPNLRGRAETTRAGDGVKCGIMTL